jgi:hypothetical protein
MQKKRHNAEVEAVIETIHNTRYYPIAHVHIEHTLTDTQHKHKYCLKQAQKSHKKMKK